MNVRLTQEQKIQLLNSQDVYKIMQQVLLRENKIRRNQEHFWVIGLDNASKILFVELIGLGTVNRVDANPPDVFRMAIYKLAVQLILVHNHPSGNIKPSQQDQDFTDRMLKVGKLINIEVVDHLVISEENYTSFGDEGIMKTLRHSGLFEIVDRDKIAIQKWKIDLIKKDAEKSKSKEMAKKLKLEGMDEDFIKKITGLNMNTIRSL